MHLEFLVEEPSAEAALRNIIPKILGDTATHQGKHDLLRHLSNRLRAYRKWIPDDWYIIVLVDADDEDCRELKARLEDAAKRAGFATKSTPNSGGHFSILNRVAMKELEAWFLGDIEAIRAAYPRIPQTLARRTRYRDPDAVAGGTWEALERVLQKAGYHRGGLDKIAAAREISKHMQPERNKSRSFHVFCEGLRAIASQHAS